MRISNSTKTVAAMAAICMLAVGGATTANAGVTGCSASGRTQEGAAVVGAVLGGLIGNKVGGRIATGETVAGAVLGAAAGSVIGCEAQKSKQARYGSERADTYTRNGYRISSDVQPARITQIARPYVADQSVNLRSAPTINSARLGQLVAGERFQAMAEVRGTDWILVGQGGVGVGYVRRDFVSPLGNRYAARN